MKRRIRRIRQALKRAGLYDAFHITLIAVLLTGFCVILFNVKEPEQQEKEPEEIQAEVMQNPETMTQTAENIEDKYKVFDTMSEDWGRHLCLTCEYYEICKRKLKAVIRDKRFYRLLCILIEHDKIALVAKILTDAGVEIDAEQTKTLVGCIAFDDISGALEVLREIGIAGAMFEELKIIIEEMRKGVPLGYFTSQWFGNFYLKALDHYIKEELHAEHYMRYMDDMVILGKSKKKLHKMHRAIETYLNDNLDLEIKGDWQVFRFEYPVMKDGKPVLDENRKQVTKGRMLDFMGFQFHHDRTTIRKSNIESARRKANHISKQDKISWYNASVMLSYMGLFKHTDTYNYYIEYIKPKINVKKLKRIVSKHSRKENEQHDRLEKGDRNTAGTSGGNRQDIVSVNGLSA